MKSRLGFSIFIIAFVLGTLFALWPQIKSTYTSFRDGLQFSSESTPETYELELASTIEPLSPLQKIEQFVTKILAPKNKLTTSSIILLTNSERRKAGIVELSENAKLNASAQVKVDDMIAKSYFEHESPNGKTVADLAKDQSYNYIIIGENLGVGTFKSTSKLVESWMASSGHRENILNPKYTEIGTSVKQGTYQGKTVWFAVQHFGESSSKCPQLNENDKTNISNLQNEISIMGVEIDTMKKAIDDAKAHGGASEAQISTYNAKVTEYNEKVNAEKLMVANYNEEVKRFNDCIK